MIRSEIIDAPVAVESRSNDGDDSRISTRKGSRPKRAGGSAEHLNSRAGLEELGRRIRKLRIERQMTLKQVEAISDLSATHLSEIERGRTAPTIGALTRIARSLKRDPAYFIETDERSEIARVPAEGLKSFEITRSVTASELTPGIPGNELFAYRVSIPETPGAEWRPATDPTGGEAIVLVSRGAVDVEFGKDSVALSAGDAAHVSLAIPLKVRSTSKGGADLIVSCTRTFSEVA